MVISLNEVEGPHFSMKRINNDYNSSSIRFDIFIVSSSSLLWVCFQTLVLQIAF